MTVRGRGRVAAHPVLLSSLSALALALTGVVVAQPAVAAGGLTVRYRTSYGPTSNQIGPLVNLINQGPAAVPLSAVTIRYWFTPDGTSPPRYYCDYTPRGCATITARFVTAAGSMPGASTYLELGFTAGAGSLPAGASTGEIQGRIAKTDWSPFAQTDDYSYDPTKTTPATWDHIGVYLNGSLAWGVEPGGIRPSDWVVYANSQSNVGDEDPEVYRLAPDIVVRAISQWSTMGDQASDYNFAQIARYHAAGIPFMGGGTASVIFREQFAGDAAFDDMSTRDANNQPVNHDEITPALHVQGARRGNIFNPSFRQYLLDWTRIQIDGGVDGLAYDEVNGGFTGGAENSYNGNEGFDDYTIADFNRYLLAKYPTFTAADWKSRFGMTDDNLPRRDIPADDLVRNFNYRTYLRAHGWNGSDAASSPLTSANPLASEWGRVTANRMYADDTSFTNTYLRRYWKEIVDGARAYAMTTYHRNVLITATGILPYSDFNAVSMYLWNPDEQTPDSRGADYVPVVDGHLDGTRSLQSVFRHLKDVNAQTTGDVPVLVSIDWPNEMMTRYLSLPLAEKKDYWQIFGAEAYANGVFPAFHIKDTVGDPTADQLGLLGFFQTYTQFFKDHRTLFRDNDTTATTVTVGVPNVSASLLVQRGTGARTLHLVNHNYNQAVQPQTAFTVTADLGTCPATVGMVSPDFTGIRTPPFSCSHGTLTATIDRLDYYDVLALT